MPCVKDLSLFISTSFTQPHTVYMYMRISFTPSVKSFTCPNPQSDSLCRQQLWSQLIRYVKFEQSSSRANDFENDLRVTVTRPWLHHEQIPRPSHRHEARGSRVSTKECPFCSFCSYIFVLFCFYIFSFILLLWFFFFIEVEYNFRALSTLHWRNSKTQLRPH